MIVEAILVLAMPFVVKFITGYAKEMGEVPLHENRIAIIRGVVAILSLIGAVLTQIIGEGQIDPSMAETSLYTIFSGVMATWMYLAERDKK